jgi:hypothetical protein
MPINKHRISTGCRYGAGIAAGITVVGWIKRKIQGIPVVGILATPFLCEYHLQLFIEQSSRDLTISSISLLTWQQQYAHACAVLCMVSTPAPQQSFSILGNACRT